MSLRPDTFLQYGETGTGKTAQLGKQAEWEKERTGKISRLISADSGWAPLSPFIKCPENPSGIIEAVNIQYVEDPWSLLPYLAEGYWPKTDSNLEPVISASGRFLMHPPPPNLGEKVGQYFIEGVEVIAKMLLQDHVRNQRKVSEDVIGSFENKVEVEEDGKVKVESMKFGDAGRSHYKNVQLYMLNDLIPRFGGSSLGVSRVVWTGHEAKGDDDITGIKQSVLGPATVGTKAVGRTAQCFGDTFHYTKALIRKLDPTTKKESLEMEFRAYYESHPDDVLTKMLWPAKLSLPLGKVAELRKAFPGGFIRLSPEKGMEQFFDFKYGNGGKAGAP